MRAVSLKRAAENRERSKVVKALKAEQIWCSRCRDVGDLDGHEIKGRGQRGSITDPNNIVLFCKPCNSLVEDEPIKAAWDGWKISGKHDRDPSLGDGEFWNAYDVKVDRVGNVLVGWSV